MDWRIFYFEVRFLPDRRPLARQRQLLGHLRRLAGPLRETGSGLQVCKNVNFNLFKFAKMSRKVKQRKT